jgi:hypothetical protein
VRSFDDNLFLGDVPNLTLYSVKLPIMYSGGTGFESGALFSSVVLAKPC